MMGSNVATPRATLTDAVNIIKPSITRGAISQAIKPTFCHRNLLVIFLRLQNKNVGIIDPIILLSSKNSLARMVKMAQTVET